LNFLGKLKYKLNSNPSQYKSEFILMFCTVTWGFSFPTIKLALAYISPNAFIFFRFAATLIIFYAFYRKRIKQFERKALMQGYILGFYLFIGFVTQTIGLKYTTASNSAFITGVYLVLVPFVQVIIIRIKPKIENIIGIIIVVAGLILLTGIRDTNLNFGDFLTLFCAVAFAFHIVFLDKYSKQSDTLPLVYGQYLAMTVLSFFSMIIMEGVFYSEFKLEINGILIFVTLFNGLFSTYIALFLAMKFQKYTTPVRAGLIYSLEQIFAVFFAFLILNEMMRKAQIIGAIIMLVGIVFSEFYQEIRRRLFIEKA